MKAYVTFVNSEEHLSDIQKNRNENQTSSSIVLLLYDVICETPIAIANLKLLDLAYYALPEINKTICKKKKILYIEDLGTINRHLDELVENLSDMLNENLNALHIVDPYLKINFTKITKEVTKCQKGSGVFMMNLIALLSKKFDVLYYLRDGSEKNEKRMDFINNLKD